MSGETARAEMARRGMFNVIDVVGGWKADLIFRKARPFSVVEFERRREEHVFDFPIFILTPEDSILSKLEWSKASGSDKQFRDAVGVARGAGDTLDRTYLSRWAAELDVSALLDDVFRLLRSP